MTENFPFTVENDLTSQQRVDVYLGVGSAETILWAATPRQQLHIELAITTGHGTVFPGRPFLLLTLPSQAPGTVVTGVPFIIDSLEYYFLLTHWSTISY